MGISTKLGRGGRALRIGYGRIFHEANAYSPLDTTRENFTSLHFLEGEALARASGLRGVEIAGLTPHAELSGFVQAANLAGNVEAVPLSSALAVPSGPVSAETFEWLLSGLVERIARAGELDGVYLALHGSMQVEGLRDSPEASILRRVREALGPDASIAASFDLHGNLRAGIVDALDVLVAYRTNPHWDLAPTGFRAGNRLIRALRGHVSPVHAWRKLPMVLGGGTTIDFLPPMRSVFRAMRAMERDERVLTASLFMVHPYTAADDLGWAVHVSTDDDRALADELADELADLAWAQREVPLPPMLEIDEAIEEARKSPWRKLGPITLVDVDDIVGAGAPGGNTRILRALLAHELRAFVPLHDPHAIEALWSAPLASRRRVILRGTPGYEQPEVELDATIAAKNEAQLGRMIRLDTGPLSVVLTERPPLPIAPKFWRMLDLNARDAAIIVQKNFFHYRLFYATTSFRHLPVVSGGATSFERVRARAYRVPTYPAQAVADWRPSDPILRSAPLEPPLSRAR